MGSEDVVQSAVATNRDKNWRRPRILLVGPLPPTTGGVTTFMLNLIASPLSNCFQFVPFTTSRPQKTNVIENWGYRSILRGGPSRVVIGLIVTLWHLAIFPFSVLWHRVDLVQIQASDYQVYWEAVFYTVMARLLGRSVVFRIGGAFDLFHSGASLFEQKLIRWGLRLPQVVIAQSLYFKDYIVRAGRAGTVVVLPNWLNDASLSCGDRQPVSFPVCLFIAGAEARRKGVEELLMVMQRLNTGTCPVRFHLVAVPPVLLERIESLGLLSITSVEGLASHSRILELMQRSDIFLLPSHGEGFPNSLLEAMGAGMASIATPVGAVPEVALGGGVLLVPTGDAQALETAIRTVAADPELRQRLGDRARHTVLTCYTAAAALPNLADAYRYLLDRNCLLVE